ncbi:tRNA (adenosine(37)-N6)-threonylcarbamoyltransferase complex ATPase subunit type 1 TsaE [Melioribacter sp. Ez-97]|uniref:tRNA (adenosine(37)-N6)-threonylcarbamoyltransferase complex ATPase subunit type 1 TsaE n=1 Tax=Melioribacter sp. Ez-97 TaxID=3423434 RepID=UPI003EDAF670
MKLPYEKIVDSEAETCAVAKEFIEILAPRSIVALKGNLGAGKTFFVNCICNYLGIDKTSSPSFSLVNIYEGKHRIYHFDFYRIKKLEELYDIGFEDYLNDENAIVFIEWADLWNEILPENYFVVELNYFPEKENGKRIIKIYENEK